MSARVYKNLQSNLLLQFDDAKLILNSRQQLYANRWIHTAPLSFANLTMDSSTFQMVLKLSLNMKLYKKTVKCDCGQPSDIYGKHATICSTGGKPHKRHAAVQRTLKNLAEEAGFFVTQESKNDEIDSPSRPGDVVIHDFSAGKDQYIDITVVNPRSYPVYSAEFPGYALIKATKDKHTKYDNQFADSTRKRFSAFALETTGGFHEECIPILRKIAKKLSEMKNVPFAEQMKRITTKISFESLRVTGQALLQRQNI